jgi:hypothetical protein
VRRRNRRLAPDARKVELGKNNDNDMELKAKLFGVMGRELGAIHAASPGAVSRIQADLAARPVGWLHKAAKTAAAAVEEDYREWITGDWRRQGGSARGVPKTQRHGRAGRRPSPGHPRLTFLRCPCLRVDARDKPAHDGVQSVPMLRKDYP